MFSLEKNYPHEEDKQIFHYFEDQFGNRYAL